MTTGVVPLLLRTASLISPTVRFLLLSSASSTANWGRVSPWAELGGAGLQKPEIPGSANPQWREAGHPSLLCAQSYAYTHQRSASGVPKAGTAAVRSRYRSVS